MIDHRYFHDAAINDIVIKIKEEKIIFHLSGFIINLNRKYDDIQIVFQNFKRFSLPRYNEWGINYGSNYSVLDINVIKISDNLNKYLIEMNIGDIIKIEAEDYIIIDEEYKPK